MYCPSCQAEFIDSITICSDCNISLVENMTPNESLENINWVKVKELPGKVFGEMMGQVLDSAEIPYFLKSDWSASAYNIAPAGLVGSYVQVYVPENFYDKADSLLNENIYVVGFSFPVVPQNQARIRLQISASHSSNQLEQALEAFSKLGKKFQII